MVKQKQLDGSIYESPWKLPEARPDKLQKSVSRVLICASNIDLQKMGIRKETQPVPQEIAALCKQQGVADPTIMISRDIAYFWTRFFGGSQGNFPEKMELPAFILATGWMRDYSGGEGRYIPVTDILKEIAEKYKVPIVFI